MTRKANVAIIGAGSAGLFALSMVRRKTDNFVLINGGELGTTCARVGCMPSKVMIQVAEDFHRRKIFDRVGIDGADALRVDGEAVMEHVQDLRDTFVDRTLGVTDNLDPEHLIEGYASFTGPKTVEVNGERIEADKFIIATGTSPVIPEAWDAYRADILTTDEIFELEDLPKSLAVIGLGFIGLELGQAMARLGVKVTGVDQLDTVAKISDPEVNKVVIETVGREFPLWLGAPATLEKVEEGLRVTSGDNSVVVDKILASLGRKPNLDSLNLEATGVELDDNGVPVYDPATMQCGDSHLFIAGDVNQDRALLHEAGHEGRVAGFNAVHPQVTHFRRKTAMGITFCDPNIATVGEAYADLDNNEIAVAELPMAPVGRALIIGKNRGVIRVYVNKSDGRVRGAAMACVHGENLAHLLAWAIEQKLTVFDLLKMPFYHPVIEEGLQGALYSVLGELDVKEETVELVPL